MDTAMIIRQTSALILFIDVFPSALFFLNLFKKVLHDAACIQPASVRFLFYEMIQLLFLRDVEHRSACARLGVMEPM